MPIVNRIADLHAEITAWRRDMHAHPELQYDVHRTAAVVADKLKGFGCDEVVVGIGRTGVVGVIRGRPIRWLGLFILFILLRSLFLGTLENPEPRYTLECYPAVIVLASAALARCAGRGEARAKIA